MTANGDNDGLIADREIEPLLARLAHVSLVVLAVSGGADSMALLHLVSRWRAARDADQSPRIVVATVDHALRPESRREAEMVAAVSAGLGFEHAILTWAGDKPKSGVQAAARDARYRLLTKFAKEKLAERRGAPGPAISDVTINVREGEVSCAVVTAHTQDDQAETVLMRLARGSGLQGLSGIAPCVERDGVWLMRPLLDIPKSRLMATLTAMGQSWIEDPSNDDSRFERVRWREARTVLESLGLSAPAIARSAQRLQRVQALVAEAAAQWIAENVSFNDGAFTTIRMAAFESPGEVALRGLRILMTYQGGEATDAELSQIETLVDTLAMVAASRSDLPPTTLGGCIIDAAAQRGTIEPVVRIFREVGCNGLPTLVLEAGESGDWDCRFRFIAAPALDAPVTVAALGNEGWASLKRNRPDLADIGLPARAAQTLPALWQDGRLAAVPFFSKFDTHLSGAGLLSSVTTLSPEAIQPAVFEG